MESFGKYLKRERELRGISLDEISRATKIRKSILEAIEADCIEDLPSEIFVVGFIKAYARYIGLDPEDVVMRYRSFHTQEGDSKETEPEEEDTARKEPYYVVKLVALILLIIAGIGILAYRNIMRETSEGNITKATPSSIIKEEYQESKVSSPQESGKIDQSSEKGETKAETLKLTIEAVEKTWVRVAVDGSSPADALLEPGDVIIKHAKNGFLLIVGNAGGVKISLNDVPQPPLGRKGEIVRINLPSKNQ